jgi:hypothetical protein
MHNLNGLFRALKARRADRRAAAEPRVEEHAERATEPWVENEFWQSPERAKQGAASRFQR